MNLYINMLILQSPTGDSVLAIEGADGDRTVVSGPLTVNDTVRRTDNTDESFVVTKSFTVDAEQLDEVLSTISTHQWDGNLDSIPVYDGNAFSWDRNEGIAEIGDLGLDGVGQPLFYIDDDDQRYLDIRMPDSGHVVRFAYTNAVLLDEVVFDLIAWEFTSLCGNYAVRVYNN